MEPLLPQEAPLDESEGSDLLAKQQEIAVDISSHINFDPTRIIGGSRYQDSDKVGSIIFGGLVDGKNAVLQIRGSKKSHHEQQMTRSFDENNTSNQITSPKVLKHIPWNEELGYEAFLLEDMNPI